MAKLSESGPNRFVVMFVGIMGALILASVGFFYLANAELKNQVALQGKMARVSLDEIKKTEEATQTLCRRLDELEKALQTNHGEIKKQLQTLPKGSKELDWGGPAKKDTAIDHAGPRELKMANEIENYLGIPDDFPDQVKTFKEKKRLTQEEFKAFKEQYGRLPNGNPIIRLPSHEYFVLMPGKPLGKPKGEGKLGGEEQREEKNDPCEEEQGTGRPQMVDHRSGQTPVRHQGRRQTCSAFSACAELEAILVRENQGQQTGVVLSPNLAYYNFMEHERAKPSDDLTVDALAVIPTLKKALVCEEQHWPYIATAARELKDAGMAGLIDSLPMAVRKCPKGWGIDTSLFLPSTGQVKPQGLDNIKDTDKLEQLLHEGHNIVFDTELVLNQGGEKQIMDVLRGPEGGFVVAGAVHSMLIVGYDKRGKTPFFIVKNSFGDQFGIKGYLYLSYDYVRTYARRGYVTTKLRSGMLP